MPGAVITERITYPSASGGVSAYIAHPATGHPWPALIVIQEIFGLVNHIEDMARRFAAQGYFALAPNLYCHDPVRQTIETADIEAALEVRRAPDVETGIAQLPAERQEGARRAIAWLTDRDSSTYIPDLQAAVDYLKSRPDVRPEAVGSIGWCMGGGLSGALAAMGADLAAAVIYYGPVPDPAMVGNIRCPVMGHYGGLDTGITSRVPEFDAAMKAAGKSLNAYVYENAPHAFSNDERPSYRPEPTKLAWERTLDFLERHLKGAPVGAR